MRKPDRFWPMIVGLIMVLGCFASNFAKTESENRERTGMRITEWLQAGPVGIPLPAFHEDHFSVKDLLQFEPKDLWDWWPVAGEDVAWEDPGDIRWTVVHAGEDGLVLSGGGDDPHPRLGYLAVYLHAARFATAELRVQSAHLLRIYLDGEKIVEKTEADSEEAKKTTATLKLETGKHLLLIKTLEDPGAALPWQLSAEVVVKSPADSSGEGSDVLRLSTDPTREMNIGDLLDRPMILGLSISADGELAAVSYSQVVSDEGDRESWLAVYAVPTGKPFRMYRGGTAISGVDWAPAGKRFAYTTQKKETSTLWVVDLQNETVRALLKDVKDFGAFQWSPDGRFIVYSVVEKPEDDKRGVKRLQTPRDRWPWFRNQSFLYRVNVNTGTRQRLTAGDLASNLFDIRPDGRQLIFGRTVDDFTHRPYTRTAVTLLDLETLAVDTLFEAGWINNVWYSPDGKTLLVTGSPRLFGEIGVNVPEGRIPNDYDTQAYLYDLERREPVAITREFDPKIESAAWRSDGRAIFFLAEEGEYTRLFRYDIAAKKFERMDTGLDVVNAFGLSKNPTRPVGVYYGSSVSTPHRVYTIDLNRKNYRLLDDPAKADFRNVQFGEVKRWRFKNARGVEIEGRVYYPPDFDPEKTYPAIVYYYGGTAVTDRSFGGRYPKNLFAAQGYVVYVLQPSGAPGYGQEFSAYHVNDWGKTVSEEIITGTQQFLAAHPFVDKNRVGCIGASYGGFMTMYLITRTDIFAAAISHAGISALSSYWGEGYWGYLYSSAATANSFPWNRRDIYVDQSPLFHADKVNTPLLLLHGDADTNVPPGESDQFYVALKLLGKTVEYVQIAGQDHHILDYKKRTLWQKTIFAWFDRWLKGQPEWWAELYPEKTK